MLKPFIIHFVLLSLISLVAASNAYAVTYRYIDPNGRLLLTDKRMGAGYIPLQKTAKGWIIKPSKASWQKTWRTNKRHLSPTINDIAHQYRIPKHLLHAIIAVESAYDPQAISHAGAQGLMQLMPATADRFGVKDPFDPKDNIKGGTRYLKYLLSLFENNLTLTLAAYNAGENAVKRYNNTVPPYRETQHYVKKVLKYYKKYKAAS